MVTCLGGWVLSQMDVAGSIAAKGRDQGRHASRAVNSLKVSQTHPAGDVVSIQWPGGAGREHLCLGAP
jgi:Acyl-CoA hydrolase